MHINADFTIAEGASTFSVFNCSSSGARIRVGPAGHLIKAAPGRPTSGTAIDNDGTITVETGHAAPQGRHGQASGSDERRRLPGRRGGHARVPGGFSAGDRSRRAPRRCRDHPRQHARHGHGGGVGPGPRGAPALGLHQAPRHGSRDAARSRAHRRHDRQRPADRGRRHERHGRRATARFHPDRAAWRQLHQDHRRHALRPQRRRLGSADLVLDADASLDEGVVCVSSSAETDDRPNLHINQDFTIGAGAPSGAFQCGPQFEHPDPRQRPRRAPEQGRIGDDELQRPRRRRRHPVGRERADVRVRQHLRAERRAHRGRLGRDPARPRRR